MKLVLENVSKSFRQGETEVRVLKNLSLVVEQSEVVAILGQSGSGKSTLLSLLSGLESPDQGKIQLGETNLTKLSEAEMTAFRAKHMGIVFQQYHLVAHLNARENVELPLEIRGETVAQRPDEILEHVGLGHRKNHFPSQLSGGECQRVAIARALVVKPQFILADEPSGNLDQATGDKVMSLFFEMVRRQKTTTILVTHNEELAQQCDRIFHLKEGQLEMTATKKAHS